MHFFDVGWIFGDGSTMVPLRFCIPISGSRIRIEVPAGKHSANGIRSELGSSIHDRSKIAEWSSSDTLLHDPSWTWRPADPETVSFLGLALCWLGKLELLPTYFSLQNQARFLWSVMDSWQRSQYLHRGFHGCLSAKDVDFWPAN